MNPRRECNIGRVIGRYQAAGQCDVAVAVQVPQQLKSVDAFSEVVVNENRIDCGARSYQERLSAAARFQYHHAPQSEQGLHAVEYGGVVVDAQNAKARQTHRVGDGRLWRSGRRCQWPCLARHPHTER